MKYEVSLIFSADWSVKINADSPEEAAEKAYNSDEANPSVCHQCAGNVNLGDCVRVIVYDENGNEVLDDGYEKQSIEHLEKQIATLTRQRDLAVNTLNLLNIVVRALQSRDAHSPTVEQIDNRTVETIAEYFRHSGIGGEHLAEDVLSGAWKEFEQSNRLTPHQKSL